MEWIPTSEGPEVKQQVLVRFSKFVDGKPVILEAHLWKDGKFYTRAADEVEEDLGFKPEHWMPLPEPPQRPL